MKHSQDWLNHFLVNSKISRVNWNQIPRLSAQERTSLLASIQAWQLGETSDGEHLLKAALKYSKKINDPIYPSVVRLFIKEEQKHGNNLGLYLDLLGEERLTHNWGDSLFRLVRYAFGSMGIWTASVLIVESIAQLFFQCLKDATSCPLLKEICTDVLIDEAHHIQFQLERMIIIFNSKSRFHRLVFPWFYKLLFHLTVPVVWFAHSPVFVAGGLDYKAYVQRMNHKYDKTFGRLNLESLTKWAS